MGAARDGDGLGGGRPSTASWYSTVRRVWFCCADSIATTPSDRAGLCGGGTCVPAHFHARGASLSEVSGLRERERHGRRGRTQEYDSGWLLFSVDAATRRPTVRGGVGPG